MIDLIKEPIFTDKANKLLEKNKYVFSVDNKLTKRDIKLLIEELFSVKVDSVNTYNFYSKKRRLGKFEGYKNSSKRVFVTLKAGNFLPFFPQL